MAKIKTIAVATAFALISAPVALWAQGNAALSSTLATGYPAASKDAPSKDVTDLQRRDQRYQVQRDDVLVISFALSPELNQTVTIQPDGYINLQNMGGVYVQGMTVPEVVGALKKAYAGTLHDPIIDVDLKDFQKPFFVALGQVNKPGQYDLRYDMTVTEAIGVAGGFTMGSRTQVFLYRRSGNQWAEVKELNIRQILQGKNVNEDAHLMPGDMIFVPEKFITKFRKYVPYGFGVGLDQALAPF
jgi:polysaccharide biosynthesis/export protein